MKIFIHHIPGSFSEKWIEYCQNKKLSFIIIDIFDNNIISKFKQNDIFLWHWSHGDYTSQIIARQIIIALELAGVIVFPNSASMWHFDDKLSQKYLFEAINAPMINSHAFYNKNKAIEWAKQANYPLVFKLRKGAGASNVKLIKNFQQANKLINQSFGKGFNPINGYLSDIKTKITKTKSIKNLLLKLKNAPNAIQNSLINQNSFPPEKNYFFVQEFMADNKYDIRVTVIGNRAFTFRRFNRQNDFRASGSGNIEFWDEKVDKRCLEIAFNISKTMHFQSMAYDFIYNKKNEPKIVELSYAFANWAIHECPGYWDTDLKWHSGHFWPESCILEDMLNK